MTRYLFKKLVTITFTTTFNNNYTFLTNTSNYNNQANNNNEF